MASNRFAALKIGQKLWEARQRGYFKLAEEEEQELKEVLLEMEGKVEALT